MPQKNKSIVLILLLGLGLWAGCRSYTYLSGQNRAYYYQLDDGLLEVDYRIKHVDDSISYLWVELDPRDLLFAKQPDQSYQARFVIHVNTYLSFEDKIPITTDTLIDTILAPGNPLQRFQFSRNAASEKNHIWELVFSDPERNYSQGEVLYFEKSSNRNQAEYFDFIVDGKPSFTHTLNKGSTAALRHPDVDSLYVRYYDRSPLLAPPPYAVYNPEAFDFKPDSSFWIQCNSPFTSFESGFFHFQADSSQALGYTILMVDQHFPVISQSKQMLEPLRYLTTNKEYEIIASVEGDSLKQRIDEFWLDIGQEPERTRQLLRTFYGRMERANELFTSTTPGYRTDRGMVYLIFGPPNILYRSGKGETWVYGKESSALYYAFNFSKVKSPFTNNEYALNRSSHFRSSWGQAVDYWRQGRIFNSNTVRQEQQYYEQRDPFIWY